jgi:hypothetical protein
MTSSKTNIYILPISGKGFSVQIGMLSFLSSTYEVLEANGEIVKHADTVPDIVMASSGGNIAAYLGHTANWKRLRMLALINSMNSEAFLTGWSDTIPSWLFFPFSKSIFRPGYGFKFLFHRMFNSASMLKSGAEIWTGTYHLNSSQHRLFTNKANGSTRLIPATHTSSLYLGEHVPPIYANGNLHELANLCMASASIPLVLRSIRIKDQDYSDGGVLCGSPLTVLSENVSTLAENSKLRMLYLSSDTLSKFKIRNSLNFVAEIGALIDSVTFNDIRKFIDLLTCLGATPTPESYFNLTVDTFAIILNELNKNTTHYGIILFPSSNENKLDFTTLQAASLNLAVLKAEQDMNAFVWRID